MSARWVKKRRKLTWKKLLTKKTVFNSYISIRKRRIQRFLLRVIFCYRTWVDSRHIPKFGKNCGLIKRFTSNRKKHMYSFFVLQRSLCRLNNSPLSFLLHFFFFNRRQTFLINWLGFKNYKKRIYSYFFYFTKKLQAFARSLRSKSVLCEMWRTKVKVRANFVDCYFRWVSRMFLNKVFKKQIFLKQQCMPWRSSCTNHFPPEGDDTASKNLQKQATVGLDFMGLPFCGFSLFGLYMRFLFAKIGYARLIRSVLHFSLFLHSSTRFFVDRLFFSFIVNKFLNYFMLGGAKSVAEALLFAVFFQLKLFTGVLGNIVLLSAVASLRTGLGKTVVLLSGKKHVVPTANFVDKQYKLGIKALILFVRKRQYMHDVSKRGVVSGKMTKRRVPLYRRLARLGSTLIKTQSFFNLKHRRLLFSKFLNSDVFSLAKKSIYQIILQRTYVQYRWR